MSEQGKEGESWRQDTLAQEVEKVQQEFPKSDVKVEQNRGGSEEIVIRPKIAD